MNPIKQLRNSLILLFIGILLTSAGFSSVIARPVVRDYTDEEIRIKAEELGMMDMKDVLKE